MAQGENHFWLDIACFLKCLDFYYVFGILLVTTSETLVARSLGNGFWNELSLLCNSWLSWSPDMENELLVIIFTLKYTIDWLIDCEYKYNWI